MLQELAGKFFSMSFQKFQNLPTTLYSKVPRVRTTVARDDATLLKSCSGIERGGGGVLLTKIAKTY